MRINTTRLPDRAEALLATARQACARGWCDPDASSGKGPDWKSLPACDAEHVDAEPFTSNADGWPDDWDDARIAAMATCWEFSFFEKAKDKKPVCVVRVGNDGGIQRKDLIVDNREGAPPANAHG